MTSCAVSDAASKIIVSRGRSYVLSMCVCQSITAKGLLAKGLYMRGTREVSERSGVFIIYNVGGGKRGGFKRLYIYRIYVYDIVTAFSACGK